MVVSVSGRSPSFQVLRVRVPSPPEHHIRRRARSRRLRLELELLQPGAMTATPVAARTAVVVVAAVVHAVARKASVV